MTVPDYQSIMLPLLTFARDQQEHSLRETIEALADKFGLTPEERKASFFQASFFLSDIPTTPILIHLTQHFQMLFTVGDLKKMGFDAAKREKWREKGRDRG